HRPGLPDRPRPAGPPRGGGAAGQRDRRARLLTLHPDRSVIPMPPTDDWRRSATAGQVRSVVRTIDPSVAHIARVQDYWLGGKDHFEADRLAGDEGAAQLPDLVAPVRDTRGVLL